MEAGHGDVLIVEDDKPLNELVCIYVQMSGFTCRAALDGRTAIMEAKAHPPKLVLLDLMLPDITGFEVCQELKLDNRTRQVPVVIVTGLGDDESRRRGMACGAAEYHVKPLSPEQLTEIVKRYATTAAAA